MKKNRKFFSGSLLCPATSTQRLYAALAFVIIFSFFLILVLDAHNFINIGRVLGPCGFKQKYDLPCPTCGMTTSALAFVQGKIIQSFYIQPAGALLCSLLLIAGFLALFTAVFGVYFSVLKTIAGIKLRYAIVMVVIILAAAWAVTLSRALAAGGAG